MNILFITSDLAQLHTDKKTVDPIASKLSTLIFFYRTHIVQVYRTSSSNFFNNIIKVHVIKVLYSINKANRFLNYPLSFTRDIINNLQEGCLYPL